MALVVALSTVACGSGESTTSPTDVGAVDVKPDATGDASVDDVIDAGGDDAAVDAGGDAADVAMDLGEDVTDGAIDAGGDDVTDAATDAGGDVVSDGGGDGGVSEPARAGRALVSAGGVMRSARYRMVSTLGRASGASAMRSGRFVLRGGLVGTIGGGR